jgi:hypothetical protein
MTVHPDEIDRRFTYHPPTLDRDALHKDLRRAFRDLAHTCNAVLPDGREKSLALTQLQDGMMWANAALACAPDDGAIK